MKENKPMIDLLSAAIRCQSIPANNKLVLMALADSAQALGATATVPLSTVCIWASCDEEEAEYLLSELIEMGFATPADTDTMERFEKASGYRVARVNLHLVNSRDFCTGFPHAVDGGDIW